MYYGLIYKVTNIETKKIYIGKTTKSVEERKREHIWSLNRNSKESQTYFYYAIRKYTVEKFLWNVVGYCESKEELNLAEKLCIDFFDTLNPIYGYNTAQGGDGGITDNRSGKTFKEHFGEEKGTAIGNKISAVKKGIPGRQGWNHSAEARAKTSVSITNWHKKRKEEKIRKDEKTKN